MAVPCAQSFSESTSWRGAPDAFICTIERSHASGDRGSAGTFEPFGQKPGRIRNEPLARALRVPGVS